jgi:hypothetical protein
MEYLKRLAGGSTNAAAARGLGDGQGTFKQGGDKSGYGGGRAGGGPMAAGKWYTVGENGVEVVSMHPGGGATVYNSKQTAGMISGTSGGSSMAARPVVNMTFVPSGNAAWDALMQALWPYLLKQVRLDGGDLTAFGATA